MHVLSRVAIIFSFCGLLCGNANLARSQESSKALPAVSHQVSGVTSGKEVPQQIFLGTNFACALEKNRWVAGEIGNDGVLRSYLDQMKIARTAMRAALPNSDQWNWWRDVFQGLLGWWASENPFCAMGPEKALIAEQARRLTLESESFSHYREIPPEYTCLGAAKSPAISWSNVPKNTKRFAILVEDRETNLVHWFAIINRTQFGAGSKLQAGIAPDTESTTRGLYQFENDFGVRGYSAPCVAPGEKHRYRFGLFALRSSTASEFGDDASSIRRELRRYSWAETHLMGVVQGGNLTATPTPLPRATPTGTPTVTPTGTSTPTVQPTATFTLTPSRTPTFTSTATSTPTADPTASLTASATATYTVTSTPTALPTATPTWTLTSLPTETPTPVPTESSTATPQLTFTATATPTEEATATPNVRVTDTAAPTSIPLSRVVQVEAGNSHTCALLETGGVKCWGFNGSGAIGDGTSGTNRFTPVNVSGLSSGVIRIAAGSDHTCALLSAGTVKCWGNNGSGQLGDGTRGINRLVPVSVESLGSNVIQVAAGYQHTCALLDTGGVQCWGWNNAGQIGDGTTDYFKLAPVNVFGLTSGVRQISAGRSDHTCGLLNTGAVKCWGSNGSGELGDVTSVGQSRLPVSVLGLGSTVSQVAAGYMHTCALLDTGGVQCWGYNAYGQIGDGTSGINRFAPVDVTGLRAGVEQVAAGFVATCALLETGGVKCWGQEAVGDGTTERRMIPVDVVGLESGVRQITVGGNHACALLDNTRVKCWGANFYGEIGDGTSTSRLTPVDVLSGE